MTSAVEEHHQISLSDTVQLTSPSNTQTKQSVHDHNHDDQEIDDGHQSCQHSHDKGKRMFYPVVLLHTLFSFLCPCYFLYFHFSNEYQGFFRDYIRIIAVVVAVMGSLSFNRITKQFKPRSRSLVAPLERGPDLKICQKCPGTPLKHARVSHCSQCRKCIYMLDHHCSFTQTCIMYHNIKSFYLFVSYLAIGALHYLYFSYLYIWQFNAAQKGYFHLILWIFTSLNACILCPMVFGLLWLHTCLLLNNMTTLETMKNKSSAPLPFFEFRPQILAKANQYDRGQIRNCIDFFQSHLLLLVYPTIRRSRDDILHDKMNPKPTSNNIRKWYPSVFRQECKIEKELNTLLDDANKLFANKLIRIGDKTVKADKN